MMGVTPAISHHTVTPASLTYPERVEGIDQNTEIHTSIWPRADLLHRGHNPSSISLPRLTN